jgi:hypothetical protein
MAHPRKDEAIEAIKAHLRDVGSKEWEPLESRFSDVPKATFWRWIKDVRDKQSDSPSRQKLQAANKKIKKVVEDVREVGGMLPATPSPAYLSSKGAEGEASMNFLGRLNLLYAEAEKLRDYSLNSEGGIRMPMYFHNSIKLRRDILQTGLSTLQEIYDLRKVQEIHDAILEAIGEVSPDVQRKVIDRLRRLDRERGITIDG